MAACKSVVSQICMRLKSCGVLQNPTTFVEADCEKAENIEFGCDRASMDFTNCLADVKSVSCAGLFPATGLSLPASCDDPLNTIPLSPAQSKCADLAAADCTRLAQCLNIMPSNTDFQNCVLSDYSNAGCGLAVDVGPTYDGCLQEIMTATCDADGGVGGPDGGASACDNAIIPVQIGDGGT
jgi:hypothetical protein